MKTKFLTCTTKIQRHCSYTIFVLVSNSLDTQVMLVLILIDVHYSKKAVLSFEKGSNNQNHSSSDSHHLVKKFHSKTSDSPPLRGSLPNSLSLFEKPLLLF